MVLLNSSKRSRYYTSTINLNTGGGSRKAGAVPSVGRDSWMSVFYGERANCPLSVLQTTYTFSRPSRSVGTDPRFRLR